MYQTILTWQHQSRILFGIIIAPLPKLLLQHINIKCCTSNYNATQHTSESRKSAEMAHLHDKCGSFICNLKIFNVSAKTLVDFILLGDIFEQIHFSYQRVFFCGTVNPR